MADEKVTGDGAYIDTDPKNEKEEINDLWDSAKLLVNKLGYDFDQVVSHLGVPAERLREVINIKMNQRSDTISKAYDAGAITEEQYEQEIEKTSKLHKALRENE